MTVTVNDLTQRFLESDSYSWESDWVDVIAVSLLLVLLAERELIRAYGGPLAAARVRSLAVLVIPLLLTFTLVVVLRAFALR
jgi:hypothetical protein